MRQPISIIKQASTYIDLSGAEHSVNIYESIADDIVGMQKYAEESVWWDPRTWDMLKEKQYTFGTLMQYKPLLSHLRVNKPQAYELMMGMVQDPRFSDDNYFISNGPGFIPKEQIDALLPVDQFGPNFNFYNEDVQRNIEKATHYMLYNYALRQYYDNSHYTGAEGKPIPNDIDALQRVFQNFKSLTSGTEPDFNSIIKFINDISELPAETKAPLVTKIQENMPIILAQNPDTATRYALEKLAPDEYNANADITVFRQFGIPLSESAANKGDHLIKNLTAIQKQKATLKEDDPKLQQLNAQEAAIVTTFQRLRGSTPEEQTALSNLANTNESAISQALQTNKDLFTYTANKAKQNPTDFMQSPLTWVVGGLLLGGLGGGLFGGGGQGMLLGALLMGAIGYGAYQMYSEKNPPQPAEKPREVPVNKYDAMGAPNDRVVARSFAIARNIQSAENKIKELKEQADASGDTDVKHKLGLEINKYQNFINQQKDDLPPGMLPHLNYFVGLADEKVSPGVTPNYQQGIENIQPDSAPVTLSDGNYAYRLTDGRYAVLNPNQYRQMQEQARTATGRTTGSLRTDIGVPTVERGTGQIDIYQRPFQYMNAEEYNAYVERLASAAATGTEGSGSAPPATPAAPASGPGTSPGTETAPDTAPASGPATPPAPAAGAEPAPEPEKRPDPAASASAARPTMEHFAHYYSPAMRRLANLMTQQLKLDGSEIGF